jgi:hypothetical protein
MPNPPCVMKPFHPVGRCCCDKNDSLAAMSSSPSSESELALDAELFEIRGEGVRDMAIRGIDPERNRDWLCDAIVGFGLRRPASRLLGDRALGRLAPDKRYWIAGRKGVGLSMPRGEKMGMRNSFNIDLIWKKLSRISHQHDKIHIHNSVLSINFQHGQDYSSLAPGVWRDASASRGRLDSECTSHAGGRAQRLAPRT